MVEFLMPFKIDGALSQAQSGVGLIVDSKLGLIIVDKHTIPTSIGDVRLTFANSIIIPGWIVYIHQVYNIAVIRYDTLLLDETKVVTATLSEKDPELGDSIYQVCMSKSFEILGRCTLVSNIRQFHIAEPIVPSYRAINVEGCRFFFFFNIFIIAKKTYAFFLGIELENPIGHGGVLADADGNIKALYASHTKYTSKGRSEFYMGIPVSIFKSVVQSIITSISSISDGINVENWPTLMKRYTLEVELAYAQVAHARLLGMSDEWVRKVELIHPSKRNVLYVKKVTSGLINFSNSYI